jgi:hypothetical protein
VVLAYKWRSVEYNIGKKHDQNQRPTIIILFLVLVEQILEVPLNCCSEGSVSGCYGCWLAYSVTVVSVRIDSGFPPMTGTFLICCCTIWPVALSNLNFFRFATLLGL